jgi:hypothetical protein
MQQDEGVGAGSAAPLRRKNNMHDYHCYMLPKDHGDRGFAKERTIRVIRPGGVVFCPRCRFLGCGPLLSDAKIGYAGVDEFTPQHSPKERNVAACDHLPKTLRSHGSEASNVLVLVIWISAFDIASNPRRGHVE